MQRLDFVEGSLRADEAPRGYRGRLRWFVDCIVLLTEDEVPRGSLLGREREKEHRGGSARVRTARNRPS
jgi:hypothetical protein